MSEEQVLDRREVMGRELIAFIREAFAYSDPSFVISGSSRFPAQISGFEDDDARSVDTDRTLELILPSSEMHKSLDSVDVCIVEVISKRFKLSFLGKILRLEPTALTIQIPVSGFVENVRRSDRVSINHQNFYDALIVAGDFVHGCLIQFTDVTAGGLGARLISSVPLTVSENIVLYTSVKNKNLDLSGCFRVIRVAREGVGQTHVEYSVGLESVSVLKAESQVTRPDRALVSTALHCTVVSTGTKITFDLNNVSALGFRASRAIPSVTWMSEGLTVREDTTGLIFRVVRREVSGEIAFKLSSPYPEERIRWSNFILPLVSSGKVSSHTHDPRALVNIFLEAGGSIVDNLAYKRYGVTHDETMSALTRQSDVLLRWVNLSPGGHVLGHHSSYRIGLNSWFTGDIVGGQAKHKKIDPTFLKKNFHSFREILSTVAEPQLVFGSWKFGHPYWQGWKQYLIDGDHSVFMERYDHISRTAIPTSVPRRKFDAASFSNLLSLDLRGLESKLGLLEGSSLRRLLGALDVTSSGVFYNGLAALYAHGGMNGFRREIYLVEVGNIKALALYSQLPAGVSINGVFDTILLLPLGGHGLLSTAELKDFYAVVVAHALSCGFRVVSVRSFMCIQSCIGVETEMVILRSEGMGYFSQ